MTRFSALALILVALQPMSADAEKAPSLQAGLDGMFKPWTQGNGPGCAAGVMQAGQWLAKGGYGSASIEHAVRITPRTVFYTASVSKQFTAAALVRLVDQGLVRLEDDVRKYVHELPEYTPTITIDNLVHQTSGLVDYLTLLGEAGTLPNRHTRQEIVGLIAARKPLFPAGQSFSYSNSNYFLIAEIIRMASGKSLKEFARQFLFEPLGMHDTRFYDNYTEVVPRYASGYWEEGRGKYRVVRTLYDQVGAGGLLTSIDDLGKWLRVYEEPNALPGSPRLGERLQERGKLSDGSSNDYAFGLVIGKDPLRSPGRGLIAATHNGAFLGYKAFFTWIPEKRLGLFALCNWAGAPMSAIEDNMLSEALR